VRKADNLPPSCAVVTESGNLNFLENSGPLRACNGTDLPLLLPFHYPFLLAALYISSSVGIATELRAGWSGIECRWGRIFPPAQTGPGTNQASCKMGTGSFPGVKCGRGLLLTTHPLLVPRSWKSRAITLPTLWGTPGL